MLKKFSTLFVILLLTSCYSFSSHESPVIYFSNASEKPITDIRAIWANDNILTLHELNPGDSRSQSFHFGSSSNFFGLVRIAWTNNEGEGVSREFYFNKNNLPSIDDSSTYNYVQIYLEQNDFEVISSDAADLSSKTKRMDALLLSYKNKFLHDRPFNVPTSLIRVEPIKDSTVPGWLNRSY
jgi:hypothetical protein